MVIKGIKLDSSFSKYKQELENLEAKESLTDEEIHRWAQAKAGAWLWGKSLENGGLVCAGDFDSSLYKTLFWDSRDMYNFEIEKKKRKLPWYKGVLKCLTLK